MSAQSWTSYDYVAGFTVNDRQHETKEQAFRDAFERMRFKNKNYVNNPYTAYVSDGNREYGPNEIRDYIADLEDSERYGN